MSPDAQLRAIASFDQQAANVVRYAQNRTEQTLEQDLRAVKLFNARVERSNEMIGSALGQLTGESLGADPDAWLKWWNDKLGLTYERTEPTVKKTTVEFVPVSAPLARGGGHGKCFAAGTPVATMTGPRPIESLKVGDVVLSQDTVTGVLSYQPIVGLHHNPPAETVRIRLNDETIVSTPVHRFWRPGRGWAMARDLKPGDPIRTLGGRAEVVEIKPESVQPVFNVDVARNRNFFVGSQKVLVRDHSIPPAMLSPFDAEPSLASIVENPGPAGRRGAEVHPTRAGESVTRPEAGPGSEELPSPGRKASILGPRTVEPAVRPPG
jgi:Pretoxin HINT domain